MKGQTNYLKAKILLDRLYSGIKDEALKEKLYNEYLASLRRAAYQGNGDAQYDLGLQYEDIYIYGDNPNHNSKKSFYWYQKACANNIGGACNNLASYFERGEACSMDKMRALSLYKKASSLGSSSGKKNYNLLRKQLNSP